MVRPVRAVPEELLLDSVASLRMADRFVQELASTDGQADPAIELDAGSANLLVTTLLQTYTEIATVHDGVRRSLLVLEATEPKPTSYREAAAELEGLEKRLLVLLASLTRTISATDRRSGSSAPASQSGRG
jgi:hypothetical protein